MANNHKLLGRKVKWKDGGFVVNTDWVAFWKGTEGGDFAGTGTIEGVQYDKDSRSGNGYYVLVRNHKGETKEFMLGYLILLEEDK